MRNWILAATAVLSMACSSTPKDAPANEKVSVAEPTGQLSLDLVGADSAGQAYRLSHATFQIVPYYVSYPGDGGGTVTLSSDTDPDATTISTRLLPGSYLVTLEDPGWSLAKVTPQGDEPVAQSVLLSAASQYAYVYDRWTTQVNYSFGVDGTLIDFRHGDLDISISVEHPDDPDGGPSPSPAPDGGF